LHLSPFSSLRSLLWQFPNLTLFARKTWGVNRAFMGDLGATLRVRNMVAAVALAFSRIASAFGAKQRPRCYCY